MVPPESHDTTVFGLPLALPVAVGLLLGSAYSPSLAGQPPGRQMPDEGREHVPEGSPIRYQHYPPTSGPHYPRTVRWGIYDVPIPEGYWVHNLEHGGIVILYNCPTGCPDLVRQLNEALPSFPKAKSGEVKLVVTPYSKLKSRLAILAWNWLDELDAFDRERLLRFYEAHVDQGPE